MRKTLLSTALVLVAAAVVYAILLKRPTTPFAPSSPPPSEVGEAAPAAIPPKETTPPREVSTAASPVPKPTQEKRAAAVKHALTVLLGPYRQVVVDFLAAQGLSRSDGERVAQQLNEGLADCLFETSRRAYEAQGKSVDELLDSAEAAWTETLAYINSKQIRSAALPCAANISQQNGVALAANFLLGGGRDVPIPTHTTKPPWAADMEARIRDHIASHPDIAVSDVLTACEDNGCTVFMTGRDIRVFDLDFDVFARQNGFEKAVLSGDSNGRSVWLQR
jgi:hypothetical protein